WQALCQSAAQSPPPISSRISASAAACARCRTRVPPGAPRRFDTAVERIESAGQGSQGCQLPTFYVEWPHPKGGFVNQAWLVTAFFFALLLLILYGAFLILTPFLTAITWAVILAILVYPVYAWLLRMMRGRATLAAIAVVTAIVIAPGVELARFLADEAVSLLGSVRALLDEEGKQQWLAQPWVQ